MSISRRRQQQETQYLIFSIPLHHWVFFELYWIGCHVVRCLQFASNEYHIPVVIYHKLLQNTLSIYLSTKTQSLTSAQYRAWLLFVIKVNVPNALKLCSLGSYWTRLTHCVWNPIDTFDLIITIACVRAVERCHVFTPAHVSAWCVYHSFWVIEFHVYLLRRFYRLLFKYPVIKFCSTFEVDSHKVVYF